MKTKSKPRLFIINVNIIAKKKKTSFISNIFNIKRETITEISVLREKTKSQKTSFGLDKRGYCGY